MKTLYFDCFSGISGDMVIGALIDAGADPVRMTEELKKLNIEEEYALSWEKVVKNGITGTKFHVNLSGNKASSHVHEHHDSHAQQHMNTHTHSFQETYLKQHIHSHTHVHTHSHHETQTHSHHHAHRAYKQIAEMIQSAGFNEKVESVSLAIFKKIGEAEGRIHGLPLEDVHFHEVGATDSIIDIVGAAILIDQMKIESIQCAAVPTGSGRVKIDHGIYPVPAPATLEILKGVPIAASDIHFELTTPTGAAIAAVLAERYGPLPSMTVESIGYGAGTKTFSDRPNVLRVVIGER